MSEIVGANKSGERLETKVTALLSDNNIPVYSYKDTITSSTTTPNSKNKFKLNNKICDLSIPFYAISQYKHTDIFNANARIDFLIVNNETNKRYYLECKNQAVPGSVDQKFPYYIHNIQHNKYDGQLIFLLNLSGIRQNVLNWLIENAPIYNYFVVSIENMQRIVEIISEVTNERIFINNNVSNSQVEISSISSGNQRNLPMSPPIKWAGGKRMIMNHILDHIPSQFNNYFEPFLGGGSVLLELFNKGILLSNKKIYISDINKPLINMYQVIKNFPNELINELKNDLYNKKEQYYNNRDIFNKLKKDIDYNNILDCIKLAALFIYLNKYGFNGMYRENRSGAFNIPAGSQRNPTLIDTHNILTISKCMNDSNIEIANCTYQNILPFVQKGDFIYLDPPYDETFTDYTKEPFGKQQQEELKLFITKLSQKGAYVMMSNSNTEFIKQLYSQEPFVQYIIDTKRLLNSNADNRKNIVQETITTNYLLNQFN
jgi:DNA adenine methylase